MVSTDETDFHTSISEERWTKTNSLFDDLAQELEKDRDAKGWPDKKRQRRMDAEILDSFEDQLIMAQAIRDVDEG